MTEQFSLPIVPRYAEVDQQGVVFHGAGALAGCGACRDPVRVGGNDDWTKREISRELRAALTSVAGQGRNATDGGIGKGTVSP